MIKAVIFDFGGVILRTQDWAGRRRWEQKLSLSKNEAEAIVFNSEMGRKAQHGDISYDEHWAWIGQRFNLTQTELSAFATDFWAGDVLDEALVDLIRRLRPSIQTALISNAFDDLRASLTHTFAIADAFDVIVISAEEGVMKPEPRIYTIALEKLGLKAEETVFIDDFARNIEGATRLGMKGIHFQSDSDLVTELQALGLNISDPMRR